MLKRVWLLVVVLLLTGVCFSEERQPMNQNELKFRNEDGTISILKRKNYLASFINRYAAIPKY